MQRYLSYTPAELFPDSGFTVDWNPMTIKGVFPGTQKPIRAGTVVYGD
jgi:hypothetical protein